MSLKLLKKSTQNSGHIERAILLYKLFSIDEYKRKFDKIDTNHFVINPM